MKKLLTAMALLAGSSSMALAADAIIEVPEAPVAIVETFTWTGFYVGLHAGYGFGETEVDGDPAPAFVVPGLEPDQDYDIDGFLGGVQVGYNHQINQLVLGVEADFSFSDIGGESDDIVPVPGQGGGFYTTDVDWFGTVRGRLGYAVDRTLFYGTGGFAYGRVENTVDLNDFGLGEFSEDEVSTGWTAGGGVEHAFTDNVTVKLEYLYVDLGDQTVDVDVVGARIGEAEFENQFHTVKLGFNYKF